MACTEAVVLPVVLLLEQRREITSRILNQADWAQRTREFCVPEWQIWLVEGQCGWTCFARASCRPAMRANKFGCRLRSFARLWLLNRARNSQCAILEVPKQQIISHFCTSLTPRSKPQLLPCEQLSCDPSKLALAGTFLQLGTERADDRPGRLS